MHSVDHTGEQHSHFGTGWALRVGAHPIQTPLAVEVPWNFQTFSCFKFQHSSEVFFEFQTLDSKASKEMWFFERCVFPSDGSALVSTGNFPVTYRMRRVGALSPSLKFSHAVLGVLVGKLRRRAMLEDGCIETFNLNLRNSKPERKIVILLSKRSLPDKPF